MLERIKRFLFLVILLIPLSLMADGQTSNHASRTRVTVDDFGTIPATKTDVQQALDWIDDNLAAGGAPAGADKYVQFNDGGVMGAEATFTYTKGTDTLSIDRIVIGPGVADYAMPTARGAANTYLRDNGGGLITFSALSGIGPANFTPNADFGDINTGAAGDLRFGADSIDNDIINWGNIDYLDNLGSIDIDAYAAIGAFASGDKFLVYEIGVGIRKADYDDLPVGGSGDLLADATVPMTADWEFGNYDLTLKSLTGDGTIEGATLTEGGNAVYNATETPGGELGNTWASPTIDDTGITLTSITIGALLGVDSIDATGAVDMDYGSDDITDHTFTTNDCTVIIDGGITVSTGDTITLGAVVWNSGDNIDGEVIADDTIDIDSIDLATVTLADFTDDLGADPTHTHTTTTISGLDVSDDINLAVTANEIVLTDDTLSIADEYAKGLIKIYHTAGNIYITGPNDAGSPCTGYMLKTTGATTPDFKMGFVGGNLEQRVDVGWNDVNQPGSNISFYGDDHASLPSDLHLMYGSLSDASEGIFEIYHVAEAGGDQWYEVMRFDADEDIHLNPDCHGDVYCFYDEDVADGANGKILTGYRKASEGDKYWKMLIDQYQGFHLHSDASYFWLQAGVYDVVDAIIATKDNFYVGHEWLASADAPAFRVYSYPTGESMTYVQLVLNDTTDNYEWTRESAQVGAMDFQMPTLFDDVTVGGSFFPKQVTDNAMDATNGTEGEIVYNLHDDKFYGCTVTGTPATWAAFN